jgi:hypothetical protein
MNDKRVLRVFPRKTTATPDDAGVRFGPPSDPQLDEADEVHVSVAFDVDLGKAEELALAWEYVTSNVKVGGPALKDIGGEFTPGMYVKKGLVITSRGCPNRCWFCQAWKNEGNLIRELKIHDGWNLLDNNILACSKGHQTAVFEMLLRQKERPRFTGGLEAALLDGWSVDWLARLKPDYLYFAYDTPEDYEPLASASSLLQEAGVMRGNNCGCYVLIGDRKDTFRLAEQRLNSVMELGYFPQAMLYNRGVHWPKDVCKQWRKFQREWANKIIVGSKVSLYRKIKDLLQ